MFFYLFLYRTIAIVKVVKYNFALFQANQPTVLMRRACEVACGTRKRKPFVVSSYAADPHNEIRRYHSEDERVYSYSNN